MTLQRGPNYSATISFDYARTMEHVSAYNDRVCKHGDRALKSPNEITSALRTCVQIPTLI